jgi:hypothetical protein
VTFNAALEEFLARRQRMQKHFKPFFGGVLEFAFFSGLVLGVLAAFLGRWYGALPFLAFLIGYGLLEKRRQAALAAGQGEEIVRRQYDRLSFAMTAALAILGLWVFAGAMRAKDAEGWVDRAPPPKTINLDLVTE